MYHYRLHSVVRYSLMDGNRIADKLNNVNALTIIDPILMRHENLSTRGR